MGNFTFQYLLEKFIEHIFGNLFRASSVQLRDFVTLGTIRVESSELTAGIPEQNEEVFAIRTCDFFENTSFCLSVDDTGKYTVLYGIQHYATIRLRRWLLIQSRTWKKLKTLALFITVYYN